jgi:hypothetical protein
VDNRSGEVTTGYINSGQNPKLCLPPCPSETMLSESVPRPDVEAAAACEHAPSPDDQWVKPVNCETGRALKATVRIPWGADRPPPLAEKTSHSERDLGKGLSNSWLARVAETGIRIHRKVLCEFV